MSRLSIDLFDDPPWPNEAPGHETPVRRSPRSFLVASLVFAWCGIAIAIYLGRKVT